MLACVLIQFVSCCLHFICTLFVGRRKTTSVENETEVPQGDGFDSHYKEVSSCSVVSRAQNFYLNMNALIRCSVLDQTFVSRITGQWPSR